MWRVPIASVTGGGIDLIEAYGRALESVVVKLAKAKRSDTCTLVVADPGRRLRRPQTHEEFAVRLGWADEGFGYFGRFKLQTVSHRGEPNDVDRLTLTLRAADLGDRLKAHRRRAFEQTTAGDVLSWVAREAGLTPRIHPAVAAQPVEYELLWDQSLIDFAADVAERVGADLRPGDGNLLAMPRGAYQGAGAGALDVIRIARSRVTSHDVEFEARPAYGSVAASWADRRSGRRRLVRESTGRTGPIYALRQVFGSEAEAQAAARAAAFQQATAVAKATFIGPGRPRARPGAKGIADGFGADIDGAIGECVSHELRLDAKGLFSTLEFQAARERRGTGAAGRRARSG